MKREQYTGLLKAYLEKESRANMDYVLADCNAYFDVAEEQGFTDEEIIESLGSPKGFMKSITGKEKWPAALILPRQSWR